MPSSLSLLLLIVKDAKWQASLQGTVVHNKGSIGTAHRSCLWYDGRFIGLSERSLGMNQLPYKALHVSGRTTLVGQLQAPQCWPWSSSLTQPLEKSTVPKVRKKGVDKRSISTATAAQGKSHPSLTYQNWSSPMRHHLAPLRIPSTCWDTQRTLSRSQRQCSMVSAQRQTLAKGRNSRCTDKWRIPEWPTQSRYHPSPKRTQEPWTKNQAYIVSCHSSFA